MINGSKLPLLLPGTRVGLLGGSFDPPHLGHLRLSQRAINSLGLNQLIWLVSPQNPLKAHQPADLQTRIKLCEALATNPKIKVSGFEAELPTPYAIDTIMYLKERFPDVDFVWIIGSDNLASLHKWRAWQDLVANVYIAVYPRQGSSLSGLSRAAQQLAPFRCARPGEIWGQSLPAWSELSGPRLNFASSDIRTAMPPSRT